jgi:hypothetical protein
VSPFQWFVAALCSWILREQDDVIAFLREENRVLRAHLRGRHLHLSDEERRGLAVLGHQLGRAALAQVATITTADTILRWHRELTARRCVQARRRGGRPRVEASVRSLIRIGKVGAGVPCGARRAVQCVLNLLPHKTV